MSDYIKSVEEQNDLLKKQLALCETQRDYYKENVWKDYRVYIYSDDNILFEEECGTLATSILEILSYLRKMRKDTITYIETTCYYGSDKKWSYSLSKNGNKFTGGFYEYIDGGIYYRSEKDYECNTLIEFARDLEEYAERKNKSIW